MPNKARDFWDKQAKKYDDSEKQFEPVYKQMLGKTKNFLTPDDHVLDFGCATGNKAIELAGFVKQIHGIDISTEMINIANSKIGEKEQKKISFTQGEIFDDILGKETFDKILSFGVIHLLEDSEKVVRRINELLKPKGLFIASTACLMGKMAIKNKLEFRVFMLIKKLGLFPLHLNMYLPMHVEKIIADQGFQIVKAESIFNGITISFIIAQKI